MNDLTVSNDPLLASSDNNTPVSSDSNTQNDSSGRKYQCKICLQMFSSANTRYRHKQKAHPDYRQTEYRNFVCIQPNCPAGFRYTWQYWKHLEDEHADSVKLEVDVLKFASFNGKALVFQSTFKFSKQCIQLFKPTLDIISNYTNLTRTVHLTF